MNILISCIAFVALFANCLAIDTRDDVILRPVPSKGAEVCLIYIQGADIEPSAYIPLVEEIQKTAQKTMKMWVGIPQFLNNAANPAVLDKGIERVLQKLSAVGMNTSTLILAGHSLGGAMVQLWSDTNKERVSAQILMGAFLTRSWKKDYIFQYSVPTLTIAGELDGLARPTRMAEAYYTQLLDPAQSQTSNSKLFPVLVVKGVTHMQFASGTPPELVQKRDLLPEISYDEAHAKIASDSVTFINTILGLSSDALPALQQRLTETGEFVGPIIEALHYEGYHNFRPPCLCSTDICEEMPNCTAACPFTSAVSQPTMGAGLPGLVVKDTNSFHDVWETEPTVHLPTIKNNCDASAEGGCTLSTTTVTQGVYHNGEDLEIWKKHFDVAWLDFGFFPVSAVELRTKMISRQQLYVHAGVKDADFNTLDGQHTNCGEINKASLDWAASKAATSTLARFAAHGQPLVVSADKDVCPAGPCWIWEELKYNVSSTGKEVQLISPLFATEADFWLPKTAGFHYCKVLSPARAMEWMYVDGLRAFYSLSSSV